MVGHACALDGFRVTGHGMHIDHIGVRLQTGDGVFDRLLFIAEPSDEITGLFGAVAQHGNTADVARCRHRTRAKGGFAGDQFDDQAVRIFQTKHRLAEFFHRALDGNVGRNGTGHPFTQTVHRHRKGDLRHLPEPGTAPSRRRPHQKADQCARSAFRIAIEQMQLFGIFIAARLFDEAEPQKAHVEVDIGLNISRDAGDVMDTGFHGAPLNQTVRPA